MPSLFSIQRARLLHDQGSLAQHADEELLQNLQAYNVC
jgi:hypothetical protein